MRGLVMRSTGSWYEVLQPDGQIIQCRLRGKFKIAGLKVTNPIAVGDHVVFEMEQEQKGIIEHIEPRHNYIIRKSVHKTEHGHLLAANMDQAVLIVTINHPKTSLGFIDRFLVTTESFRIPSVLIVNKIDLLTDKDEDDFEELKYTYAELGYPVIETSATEQQGVENFRAVLAGKKSLIAGHSGVGKSTLVNAIAPHLDLRTNEISTFANKGVHTTTFAEMFQIDTDTFIVDSPGIKELGLLDVSDAELPHYFPEMRAVIGQCKFHNCQHTNEPKCAVKDMVASGEMAATRYMSYLSILENDDNRR